MGELQCDLDKLFEWADTWNLEYNVAKCAVIYWCVKQKAIYMRKCNVQMDLCVLVHQLMKLERHIQQTIRSTFIAIRLEFGIREVFLWLCRVFIRPPVV